jgi:calnexin
MAAGRCLVLLALVIGSVVAKQPSFFETFESGWKGRWIHSDDDKYTGKFQVDTPDNLEDEALKVPEKAKHYGLTTRLQEAVDPAKGLVLQYELKLSEGLTCGGAYLKFLTETEGFEPAQLKDDTPYTIMFGPDKCGSTNKVHFIIRHKSPFGEIEEKHLETPPLVNLDKDTHVYTAVLNPEDNTYAILIDGEEKKAGSLFEDFKPAFNPPEEIDDPEDSKPDDWVDEAKISDPEASKPEDWDEDAPREVEDEDSEKPEGWLDDEPLEIDDPEAEQPDDWDEEEDGEWEPPKITNPACETAPGCGEWKRPTKPNPNYKGKWSAPLIDNPAYKGVWKPRKIPNPKYFNDDKPLSNIGKVGGIALEIWTMDEGYYFDNVLVSNDADTAAQYREKYWKPKHDKEEEVNAAKKAEEDASADKEEETTSAAAGNAISRVLDTLFEQPGLSLLKPYAQTLLDNAKASLITAAIIAGIPALLLPLLLFWLLSGSKKPAAKQAPAKKPAPKKSNAAAKKTDAVTVAEAVPVVEETVVTEEIIEEAEDAPVAVASTRRRRAA